jgi:hypothetical protein
VNGTGAVSQSIGSSVGTVDADGLGAGACDVWPPRRGPLRDCLRGLRLEWLLSVVFEFKLCFG